MTSIYGMTLTPRSAVVHMRQSRELQVCTLAVPALPTQKQEHRQPVGDGSGRGDDAAPYIRESRGGPDLESTGARAHPRRGRHARSRRHGVDEKIRRSDYSGDREIEYLLMSAQNGPRLGEGRLTGSLTVNVFSVANFDDVDQRLFVVDAIQNTIVALSNPVPV
jgi:hypothetical protein